MDYNLLMQAAAIVVGAGAIYGGIRADLKQLRERVESNAQAVGRAHERMDRHVEQFHAR